VRAYYDRRAAEYDDWWLGTGLFAGLDRPEWGNEVDTLTATLEALPLARTLDVACGTGFLTQHLPGPLTALDQSRSMLDVIERRLPEIELVLGDALALPFADGSFDRVFTGHFYGHLGPGEREQFIREARRVAPELIVVDSAVRAGVEPESMQARVLGDGSCWTILKRYFTGAGLAAELGGGRILHDARWFVAVAA
jgi:demethylmenaquinone methyltransferase/2-methoxy-6-polyprenyl-1,4-benzoquinol methylase